MNTRTINISSLVILLALLSFICEGFVYYFLPQPAWSILFAVISSILLSHFFLEMSLTYTYNFIHALFMTVSTAIFSTVIYLIQPNQWISYHFSLVILVLVNWLTPFFYCTIRDLLDRGPRFDGYTTFFHRMNILLIGTWLLILIKQYYLTPIQPPYEELTFGAQNFVPFMATGTYLEEIIQQQKNLIPIACYLAEMILLYIPFGYYIRVYCRKLPFIGRLIIYFAGPLVMEFSQLITKCGRSHIDDYVLALFGTLIGIIIYHGINLVFHTVASRDFTARRNTINLHHYGF